MKHSRARGVFGTQHINSPAEFKTRTYPRAEAEPGWAGTDPAERVGAGTGGTVHAGPDLSFRPPKNKDSCPGHPFGSNPAESKTRIFHGRGRPDGVRRGGTEAAAVRPEHDLLFSTSSAQKTTSWTTLWKHECTKTYVNGIEGHDLSSPKPGHTTGGSGRGGARRGSGAGRGGAGQHESPTDRSAQEITVPVAFPGKRAKYTTVLNASSEARTKEIPCKPMEEQTPRLTSG